MSAKQKVQRVKPHSSLRAWRKAHGYGQVEAARILGISQSSYCKLERHERAPRPVLLKRLTNMTGVPIDELLGIAS